MNDPLDFLELPYKCIYLKDRELKYLVDVIYLILNDERLKQDDPQGNEIGERLYKYFINKIREER